MCSREKRVVIEISSSSDEETNKNRREAEERRRYSDVEVKTGEEKWREEEDCCILPFDPFAADRKQKLSLPALQHQLDDLSVVAERGQVACRDYPHSRHLCAEYPFSKTTHESCCFKCYCYVCDKAAPCKFWKGPNGHCHASDRDKSWKEMRKFNRPIKPRKVKTHF
ncbi:uncharacterized protein LOC103711788 [Phoenix dactylifera]|uniref:Uncharacterized protein LOC103711788 n=1 Tax=Phoenix dactylifera TaxID=42345 RepID=A0A8B7CCL1_PHODC|nr:uncharacterized protein LOC103711788 [Phoenix dactylifera]